MTYEEAIFILHPKTCAQALDVTDNQFDAIDIIDEASLLACEALEKQIPKTPKIFKEKYMQPDYLCPVCYADVDHEWDCCAGCGQALNWEGAFG